MQLPDAEIVSELESRGQLLRTDKDDLYRVDDEVRSCELNPHKIGPDADETPGGCNNILITIAGSGSLAVGYNMMAD